MYDKNDIIELNITDLSTDGDGVGKTDDFTWFVKDTVPGDRVKASVMKVKKTYGYARLVQVLEKSSDRVTPRCPVARSCGGCSIQCMNYEAQLRFKQSKVENNLRRIGGFTDIPMKPIIGMEDPWRYRNKAIVPFGRAKNGKVIYGFFARHSHDIISCSDCMIGHKDNEDILEVIKKYYSDPIRNVLIKRGFHTGEIMVCIIASEARLKDEDRIVSALTKPVSAGGCGVGTVVLNINKDDTNVVLGDRERILAGSGYIEDTIDGLRFRISAKSFFQVNPIQVEKLYGKAVEYADLKEDETAWDLYCGTGTITLSLAKSGGKVCGVEIVEPAIRDAEENARLNGIENVRFICGKAEEVLPREYERESGNAYNRPDVILVDPPRKGCDAKCIDTMLRMQPDRIVYVSCDSATLARDLRILCDGGYELKEVQPVDMFPQSVHTEVVSLLYRTEGTTGSR